MNKNTTTITTGLGFPGALAIVFTTLKLIGKITWPWLWVLSPIWIPLVILIIVICIWAIVQLRETRKEVKQMEEWRRQNRLKK